MDANNTTELPTFEVLVGNVGTIYTGKNFIEALRLFEQYCAMAKLDCGRTSGESVTLWRDGEITREQRATLDDDDSGAL